MLLPDSICQRIAETQHGLVTRSQALEAGITARAIERRLDSGLWMRVRHNVYRISGAPKTWHQDELALCFWGGDGTMSAGRAGAAVYDLRTFPPGPLEISSPSRLNATPGAIVHLMAPYLEMDPVLMQGIPTPSIERVIYELAVVCGKRRAKVALHHALVQNLTTLDRHSDFIESIARRGRPAIRISREMIDETDPRAEQTRSRGEIELLRFFDGVILPIPEVDFDIYHPDGHYMATADFAHVEVNLDIEADGDPVHTSPEDRARDKRRDRMLSAIGWRVIRFTNYEIFHERRRVIRDIRANLIALGHPFFS